MTGNNTPALPVREHRPRPTYRKPSRPSGPGTRWNLPDSLVVRFNKDMTRVYREGPGHRNLVQLRYLDTNSTGSRPSDTVLTMLLRMFNRSPVEGDGNRCWILRQTQDGWTLTLDVKKHDNSFVMPPIVSHQGTPVGVKLNRLNVHEIAYAARTLWRIADHRILSPEHVSEEEMTLVRAMQADVRS